MPVRVKSLSELSAATVQANQSLMSQLLTAAYPELDTSRGVLHDIICFLAGGVVNGVTQTELQRIYDSRSMLAVQANPALYDADIVDNILSNFFISKEAAARAAGNISVVVSENVTTIVPSGTTWSVGSIKFTPIYPVVARVFGDNIVSGNDRPLLARGDGTFEFTVPVVAEVAGTDGNVRAGLAATPSIAPARFVKAFTTEDFSGGKSEETISELITRISNGIPAAVAAGGENIKKLLRTTSGYASADFSVVGFGNKAQLRDKRSVFPIAIGNRVDVYSRTTPNTITVSRRKLCTLVEKLEARKSLWRVTVAKQDLPGFYRVLDASLATSNATATFPMFDVVKAVDLSNEIYTPDIRYPEEGFFSAFQTATGYFYDTLTPTATLVVGDTAFYNIALSGQPGIDTLQQVASSEKHRMWGGDVVVKAAVPADVYVDIVVESTSVTLSEEDKQLVKSAAASAAAVAGFPGKLFVSKVIQAASAALPLGSQIKKLAVNARILLNNNTEIIVTDKEEIVIPDTPSLGVTPSTVGFFCHPSNVSVVSN